MQALDADSYQIPTETPESDGTLCWNSTTLLVVHAHAGAQVGLGYSYTHAAAGLLVRDVLDPTIRGMDALDIGAAWDAMRNAVRNIGQGGLAATAIAAVDTALWDLKARLLGVPLVTLFGARRQQVEVYGSGGFTSSTEAELREQLGGWAAAGMRRVKMKIGRTPERDLSRVHAVRDAIGPDVELFVDANGAFTRKQALGFAERQASAELDVTWFEEPVSSNDLEGLRLLRDRVPAGMAIAAGEYGYDVAYFRRMLEAGAVDVLQADATRCAGYTGFLEAAALCAAHEIPLSAHTAPLLHLPVCYAAPRVLHLEYFEDHARIERRFFDGVPVPEDGVLRPRRDAPGLGVALKRADIERYRV
ncbi:MAG: enolase C-terminal domain-like protein [Longimicrobiales bacterium]